MLKDQMEFLRKFSGFRSKVLASVNLFLTTIVVDYMKMRFLVSPLLKRSSRVIVGFEKKRFVLRFPSSDFSALNETNHKKIYDAWGSPRGVIIDAGAHIGTFTIRAGMVKGNFVYSFEPEPQNFRLLESNIRLNGLRNVRAFRRALGRRREVRLLNVTGLSTVNPSFFGGSGKKVPVEVVTIDSMLGELKGQKVDYVKIDVEGAELEVLEGARETLKKFRPVIVLETDDIEAVMNFLKAVGYDSFNLWKSYSNMKKMNIIHCKSSGR